MLNKKNSYTENRYKRNQMFPVAGGGKRCIDIMFREDLEQLKGFLWMTFPRTS